MRDRTDGTLPRPSLVARVIRGTAATGLGIAMLTTGLIVLVIAGAESGGVAFALALCLAILPVPIYLSLVLWIDRFEPEPVHMIILTFCWGATIACFVAILLNTIGEVIVAEELGTEAAEIYGASISAPVVEEAAKAAVLFGVFWWKRDEFNGLIDGIVYAGLVGLGFAMTENVLYYGRGARRGGKQAKRAMGDLQQVAAELAFHREKRASGLLKETRLADAHQSALRARIALRRNELAQLAA